MPPPGQHTIESNGRRLTVTWLPHLFVPPRALTTQALGLCFTPDREIVLVSADNAFWTLPGGTLEPGETAAEAFAREVAEEACARVLDFVYLGCQCIDDPDSPTGPTRYFQSRFWARVALDPFIPKPEIVARRLVTPEEFLATLTWGQSPIAPILLERALAAEAGA